MIPSRIFRAVALALALAAAPADLAVAQEPAAPPADPLSSPDRDDITVYLKPGQRAQLRLAYPSPGGFDALSPEARAAAIELDQTLRADLLASGVFSLQGPEQLQVLALTGDPAIDFDLYRSLANELLLEVELSEDPGRLVLEGRLFELASGRNLMSKRYRGTFAISRRVAHTFADEIVRFFTGRRGLALTSIAFQSDRAGDGSKEIWVMDYDGWNQRPVTAHGTLSLSPDFHPNGASLLYVSYLDEAKGPGIHLVDLRTGTKRPVITDGPLNSSPAFSPDGRSLALTRSVGGGNSEIFVADLDGGRLRRLTNSGGIDANPSWSPTGREIAFTSSRSGSPQIYVMSSEGTDLRRVSFQGDYNDGAVFSPDGARIAHVSRRGRTGGFDIALTDLVTLESEILNRRAGSDESPTFSPDGRKIAFAGTRGGVTQIYVMNVDGSDLRQLTTQGSNSAPSWSGYVN